MFAVLNDLVLRMGLPTIMTDIIVSFLAALILAVSVVIIGEMVNRLEQYQMRIIARSTGVRIASFVCNRLTFPGIIIHELSHALFVILTGARLIRVCCFEIFKGDRLGHVDFALDGSLFKQRAQLSLISCAPVLTGLLIENILIKVNLTYNFEWYIHLLLWYLIISVADHMSMSKVDVQNYKRGMVVVFPIMMILMIIVKYLLMTP